LSIIVTVTPPTATPIVLDPLGSSGALGSNGWTPVLAIASDGARRVLQVVDWAGGEDIKPAVGQYVGAGSTLVADIADAVDIRGTQGAQGPQGDPGQILTSGSIFTGDGVPDISEGVDNDIYIDNLTADLYQKQGGVWVLQTNIKGAKGDKGDTGDTGTPGLAGADGDTLLIGSGVPASGLGFIGDAYIDNVTFTLYQKTGTTVWTQFGVFKGANGNTIRVAAGAPDNAVGINGDAYINATNGDLYNRTAGTYSLVGNLKGPQGATGAQGGQGIQGDTGTAGASVLTGATNPASGLGANGDSYVNTVSFHYFTKAAGAWTDQGSLKGADGIGNAFFTGTGAPGTISGSIPGDIYIDTANGDVYKKVGVSWTGPVMNITGPQGQTGAQGPAGGTGATGAAGKSLLNGSGAPTNVVGNDGDSYINRTTGDLYGPKASGAWPSPPLSLIGPQGPTGGTGATGAAGSNFLSGAGVPDNTLGANGDTYLNVTTGNLYGPKSAGAWGAIVGSLKGAQGNQGIQGATGATGTRGATWSSGAGAPSSLVGRIDGDMYLRSADGEVYAVVSGAWVDQGFSLLGPQGAAGSAGATGTRGSLWYNGTGAPGTIAGQADGDYYTNNTNGEVYRRVAGAWVDQSFSIKGPAGADGAAGATGAAGPSNLPMTSVSAARTISSADKGTCLFHPSADTTARTWTIDNTSSWTNGDTLSFCNANNAGALTIAISGASAVLRLTGGTQTGNRVLAANGMATAVRAADGLTWYITGQGLT
jgi:hypothetical protein